MSINRQDEIRKSINGVMSGLGQVDPGLGNLFGRISEEILMMQEKYKEKEIPKDIIKNVGKNNANNGRINTIPFGEKSDCFEDCLVTAFGKLKSQYGLLKILKKTNDYWLKCGATNTRTLIITDSWDFDEFYTRYKSSVDSHTLSRNRNGEKHTVGIILFGYFGFSLQYAR